MKLAAVLFDLDGTLVDTAPDLVAVLNRLLTERGRPPMPYALARNEVSNGALGLIRLGFGSALAPGQIEDLRRRFLEIYSANVCIHSRLFIDLDSISSTLHEVSAAHWGIVTNKPAAMTVPLLEQLGLAAAAGCIVSGDSLPQRKPHPAPLLLAARELGLDSKQCVYVGDAVRDIEAGRAAGMRTIAALWGYIRANEKPLGWQADVTIRHPTDLAGILRAWSPRP
jgi:N-acetyl-D-muramate 6-phosphate phosphatase